MARIEDLDRVAAAAADVAPDAAATQLAALEELVAAVDADRAAGTFTRWGRAVVRDPRTGAELLPRPLFEALHDCAGLDASWPVGNAGLLQTYGSLLSPNAPAEHGRERWYGGALATALGLDPGAFAPWAGQRTLLSRATEAAAVLIASGGEFSWYSLADGRATRAVLSHERAGSRAFAYAVAPEPGFAPLLVALFPVADAEPLRRELDEASSRLRWGAA